MEPIATGAQLAGGLWPTQQQQADHRLLIGLKNGASSDGSFERAMVEFTDWALNEECNTFDECSGYSVFVEQNKAVFQVEYMHPTGTTIADFCPNDNAANFDGLLKDASGSLAALPRIACRLG